MRLVPTQSFDEGVLLCQDLPARPGAAPLLRAGVTLRERDRDALLGAGIGWI